MLQGFVIGYCLFPAKAILSVQVGDGQVLIDLVISDLPKFG